MEDEAHHTATLLWRDGAGGGGGAAAAYCTIWALVAMLLSFRALMALTILFLLLLVEGWDKSADTQSQHTRYTHTRYRHTHTHTQKHRNLELMAAIPPRLLRGNGLNERQSATEWPSDHPFYCLTNSPCLCHLAAQRDPQDRAEREGGGQEA